MDRKAALEVLRRCAAALGTELAPLERERMRQLHSMALAVLEQLRPTTEALRRKIARLERQMPHLNPGEKREAITRRLGISNATYYRQRPASRKILSSL